MDKKDREKFSQVTHNKKQGLNKMILEFKEIAINLQAVESIEDFETRTLQGVQNKYFTITMRSGATHDVGSITKAEFLKKWKTAVNPKINP
tara:strand:- start:77 stop:349 length:273 start_codon:yes stop_codon:yes gene_type:complete